MPWNISTKEEKEQKTQEYLLKDIFGKEKASLYFRLNLGQFVKEDGTVKIEELKNYLKQKGFSDDAVNNVEECLNTKAGDTGFIKATADMISAEFYRITLQDNFFDKNADNAFISNLVYSGYLGDEVQSAYSSHEETLRNAYREKSKEDFISIASQYMSKEDAERLYKVFLFWDEHKEEIRKIAKSGDKEDFENFMKNWVKKFVGEFGYSDQIAVQLTDNLTDGFWNFLRFIYSPDGFDRLAECIKNGDEKGWEKYVEGMDFHGKTYLFDVAKGFYLTAEETMTTVYVYLYFNASGEKRNNILEEAKKAGIKFGDLALLIYKAGGQEGLKELIKHSKGIYSNLEISTGLGVLAYEGLIDADFYHSLVSEFGLVDLSSAENIKNILDRLEKFAEESAEFKEWLEENVNMQDLENAVKELDAKGLEKSSEETKRVVEEVIKALDKIIETTVNEDRRRVAEILKEMLEGMMGVEG